MYAIKIQELTDLVIDINNLFKVINELKNDINYMMKVKENKIKYEVSLENFQFESLEIPTLKKTREKLEKEYGELEKERNHIKLDFNSEDYK